MKHLYAFFILIAGYTLYGQAGSLDLNFVPSQFNGNVLVILPHDDGKVIVAGEFTHYNNQQCNRIVRLNPDGTRDLTFNTGTGASGAIRAMTFQSDGKILIAGDFWTYNNVSRNKVARLNSDGTLDMSFTPPSDGFSGSILAICQHSNGTIYIGGNFTSYGGASRYRLAQLNSSGAVTSFNVTTSSSFYTGPNNTVLTVSNVVNSQIYAGGQFTQYNAFTERGRMNTLNGFAGSSFQPGFNNNVRVIKIQPDGKILVGGDFSSYNNTTVNRIVRLNSNLTIDNTFDIGTGFNGQIFSIETNDDGDVFVGGNYSTYKGQPVLRLVKLDQFGNRNTDFNIGAGANSQISSIAILDNSRIAIAGNFSAYNNIQRNRVAVILDCEHTYGTDLIESCGAYTWIDGVTYTESNNTATHIVPNAAGCDSIITLNLTIEIKDEVPTGLELICPNTSTNIDLSGSSIGVNYYLRNDSDNSIVDGPIAGTGNPISFSTGNLSETTTFNVQGVTSCEYTMMQTVTISVSLPEVPTGNTTQSFCSGTIADLEASGTNVVWYDSEIGGNMLDGTHVLQNNQTYYAESTFPGCQSAQRLGVMVEINNPIEQSISYESTICSTTPAVLTFAGSEADVKYYVKNNADNNVIAGPVQGTGGSIDINIGNINNPSDFNVFATKNLDAKALLFNGNSGHVSLNSVQGITSDVTVESWVEIPSTLSWTMNHSVIFDAGSSNFTFTMIDANNTKYISVLHPNEPTIGSYVILPSGISGWHHFTMVVNSNNMLTLYLNGNPLTIQNSALLGTRTTGSSNSVGARINGNNVFNGKIDEVRVWNYQRTQAEIIASMNDCAVGNEPGLALNYDFDIITNGTTVVDKTNNYPGTLQNMNLNDAWVDGVFECDDCSLTFSELISIQPIAGGSGTDVVSACDSYTWIDGNTYTSSNNTATHIIPNPPGCDSVVTLNLTINQPTFGTDVIEACGSHTWIDGITYTESNNSATHVLQNAAGCDSTVTLNLTISIPDANVSGPAEVCLNSPATISLSNSDANGMYFLRNDANNAIVDGPIAGTGAGLTLNTGNLTQTTTYNVLATIPVQSEALDFDGINDGVHVGQIQGITNSVSVEAWIFPKGNVGVSAWDRIFDGNWVNNFTFCSQAGMPNSLNLAMGGTSSVALAQNVLVPNEWQHVAFTYDDVTKVVRLYRNGTEVATGTYTGGARTTVGINTIGSNAVGTEAMNAIIDEVRLWNTARTPAQLNENMNTCLTGNEPGLVLYFDFDDEMGSPTVTDKTGNGHNGTLVNMNPANDWVTGATVCVSCEHEMTQTVTVAVSGTPAPSAPTATSPQTSCNGTVAELGASGSNIQWYDAATGGNLLAESTPLVNNTIYYASQTIDACESVGRTPVTAQVLTLIDQTVNEPSNSFLCENGSSQIAINSSEKGINYSLRNENNVVVSGPSSGTGNALSFNTGNITETSDFHVLAEVQPNTSIEFDGANDFVNVGTSSAFNFSGAFTIETWIKVSAFDKGWQAIVTKGDNSWRLHRQSNTNQLSFATDGLTNFNLESNAAVNDGNWHHVAAVYTGTQKLIYINGVLDASAAATGVVSTSNMAVLIGENSQAVNRHFNGKMDEVRIWNVARTQAQIQANLNNQLEGNETGLLAYYRFNELAGAATALDYSTNNFNATLTNMNNNTVRQSDVPFQAPTCSFQLSETKTITVDPLSVAPSAVNSLYNMCHGGSTTLEIEGGSLASGADWEWFSGTCNTSVIGTGSSIEVTPTANTSYFARASAGSACPPSVCADIQVNLPATSTNLSLDGDVAACFVNQNEWVHFYNSNGRLIASINSGGQDLGNVSINSIVSSSAAEIGACDEPNNPIFMQAVLGRSFVVTPEHQPAAGTSVQVRFYITESEFESYQLTAENNQNTTDDVNAIGDLNLTKVSNGLSTGIPSDLCDATDATVEYFTQSNSGDINALNGFTGFDETAYLEFTIDGFSEFFIMNNQNSSALPVQLTAFSATCDDDKIQISWTTASELNASHYILQSSRDGQTWLHLAQINAAGTTSQTTNYSYSDQNFGGLTYYRLVQVDNDGQQEIFGPISSNCSIDHNLMTVHPNPSSDNFTVIIQTSENMENTQVDLVDMSGRVILSQQTTLNAGSTMLNFDVKAIQPGAYMIRVLGENDKFTPIRVVKM